MKISNYIKTLGLTLAIAAPMYKAPLYAQLSEKAARSHGYCD